MSINHWNSLLKPGETGNYYYGARYYDPKISVWLSVDPVSYAFPNVSPFTFNMNNPIMMVDPGGDSTFVIALGDGKYEVDGVETKSGDKGVYEVSYDEDGNRSLTGEKIGNTATTHSFVDENGKAVKGAIIDINDNSGQTFIDDEIIADHPGVWRYKNNATLGEHYDFKTRDEASRGSLSEVQYRSRGMMLNGEIVSARDIGNIAAGMVMGRANLPWGWVRKKFDEVNGGPEPPVSRLAQLLGFRRGGELYIQDLADGND